MSSLADQLLKAGLVDEKKAKKAKKQKRKENKVALKTGQETNAETKQAVEQAKIEKAKKDQALNAEKNRQAELKAIQAQIRQLIELNKQKRYKAEQAYSFEYEGVFKKIYVTDDQQIHLSLGRLAIGVVKLNNEVRFELIPKVIADKVAERDASKVVYPKQEEKAELSNLSDEEKDWYADYEIPDDLMW